MKTNEEPLNEYEAVNEPEEGAIPDSDAESAAGGLPDALAEKFKIPLRCLNPDCKLYYKSFLFKLSAATQYCSECNQPMG